MIKVQVRCTECNTMSWVSVRNIQTYKCKCNGEQSAAVGVLGSALSRHNKDRKIKNRKSNMPSKQRKINTNIDFDFDEDIPF
jgi:hypothetical protein